MMLNVYFDELDGILNPQWMLITTKTDEEYMSVTIDSPFERFYQEDFHDEMAIITVTSGAMTRDPFKDRQFSIHIPTVKIDMTSNDIHPDNIYQADYFLIRLEDLEELLQFDVSKYFII
ncbi:hypothetical protein [Alkalicoccobacillus porphyridii]|uniref:Uncharacterized protein n=1 Tax=Alkalicoccobacillus porphyridii TaxID=2597270 RepID=A0A554A0E5_9BACI|nr:hypothetical protein [Alkalicoccobacillus porphyridii]TSB47155.1 hypothetical protein FN960_09100 [Alkalicoccobacillus porphyridii]